jgi:hypothetical protein
LPGHMTHVYLDRLYFKKAYWKVHQKMDLAWPYLGKTHRVVGHDPISAIMLAREAYPGDPNAESAALLHTLTDDFCSANPMWKLTLEGFAYADAKRRREARRKGRKRRGRHRKSKQKEEAFVNALRFYLGSPTYVEKPVLKKERRL